MGDLVVPRKLVRSTSVRGQSVDSDSLFRKVALESQFGRIVTRGTDSPNTRTMAAKLEFIGIRPTSACAGVAESSEGFARWYSKILRAVVHIDAKGDHVILFHRAMQNIYRLAKSHDADSRRGESDRASRSTRPASSALQDRPERTISVRQSMASKRAKAGHLSDDGSPKVRLSLCHSGTTSSRAPSHCDVPFSTYRGVELDPIHPIAHGAIAIPSRTSPRRPMTVARPCFARQTLHIGFEYTGFRLKT